MNHDAPLKDTRPPCRGDWEIYRQASVEGRPRQAVAIEHALNEREVDAIVRRTERFLASQLLAQDPYLVRTLHLYRLEHQWREAMEAWYRSQRNQETLKASHNDGDDRKKMEQMRRTQTGDVRYLRQALLALAEIRKLGGVDATGGRHRDEDDRNANTDADPERAGIIKLLAAIRKREGEEADRILLGNDRSSPGTPDG